jgi:deoxyribonuclease IV
LPIGAHMSIAGGLDKALTRGLQLGCETIQLFTRNRNQWRAKPLAEGEVGRFREAQGATAIRPILAHTSYLINLASPDREIYEKSLVALQDELERAALLGIPYLVTHPGSHKGNGESRGLARITTALDLVLTDAKASCPLILLETTAGQGSSLGYRFEHLAKIRDRSQFPERLGFCFDTAHVFAAGYDIRGPVGYGKTLKRFIDLTGAESLKAFHLNDSQKEMGSRVDRHHHVGRGTLGRRPFYLLLHDERFSTLPMVLETPKGTEEGRDLDEVNLDTLRQLRDLATFPGG